MRVIAGQRRGLKLLPPKTSGTRPITDRVKESVFSILKNKGYPENKRVADLFCGTGSLGIEALSREAEFCLFAEKDPRVLEILNKNLQRAQFLENSKHIRANVFKVGAPVDFDKPCYDLVFVDPPYALSRDVSLKSQLGKLLLLLNEQIVHNGLALVRTDHHVNLLDRYGSLQIIDVRQWGTMKVFFFQNNGEEKVE